MRVVARTTILLMVAVLALWTNGCGEDAGQFAVVDQATPAVPEGALAVEYSETDLDMASDLSDASHIIFSDGSARIEGTGASVEGSVVTVSSAGTYLVSGASVDGQIFVDLDENDVVRFVLNEVDLASSVGAPILIESADKVVITLQKGTDNSVACTAPESGEEADSAEPDAAIFSRSDLTINGTGSLEVTSDNNHGIVSKDDLKIVSGAISVSAAKDAIQGRDCVGIRDGEVVLDAGGDGLQSDNGQDESRGYVSIEGGVLDITAGQDGVQAENTVLVLGGTIAVRTGGRSEAGDGATSEEARDVAASPSAQGLRSAVGIYVAGGVVEVDSLDDAINSSGLVQIDGGSITVSSGDDGVHADDTIEVNGGMLDIVKSFEGLESAVITFNDGTVRAVASDDAISAVKIRVEALLADGSDQKFSDIPDGSEVHINGGYVVLDGSGDGLDSNGSIFLNGGTVIVNGPAEGMNVAIDYNGEFIATGGCLIAAGASRLAEAPGGSSTQKSMLVKFDSQQDAGTLVHVVSADGEELLTFRPVREYQSLAFSSPDLTEGVSYDIYLGGSSTGVDRDGVYEGGAYSGGTKYGSLTISGALTTHGVAGGGGAGRW